MNSKSTNILILTVFFILLLCGIAFALCYEATAGKLQTGSIANYAPSIEVYNGEWQSVLTTREKGKIVTIQEVDVYKVWEEDSTRKVWKYAKKEESKTQSANGKHKFVLKDAIVTVHGYKWIESLQAQTAKVDLNEIKTIGGVIYPKDGFKLISLQCSFEPKTFGDVKFKNIRITLYANELKSNLVCWYLTFGNPPMKMAMSSISKGACRYLKHVVVFVVPNSASENNISVVTNTDDARPIVNLRVLETEKI